MALVRLRSFLQSISLHEDDDVFTSCSPSQVVFYIFFITYAQIIFEVAQCTVHNNLVCKEAFAVLKGRQETGEQRSHWPPLVPHCRRQRADSCAGIIAECRRFRTGQKELIFRLK